MDENWSGCIGPRWIGFRYVAGFNNLRFLPKQNRDDPAQGVIYQRNDRFRDRGMFKQYFFKYCKISGGLSVLVKVLGVKGIGVRYIYRH